MWTCFFCGFPNKDRHEMCERCGCERRGIMDRTYTSGEMFLMLEENPDLKFVCFKGEDEYIVSMHSSGINCYYRQEAKRNGEHYKGEAMPAGLRFFGNININDRWQIVRTPVTWQEALQALIEGRTVLCQCADCTGKVMHKDENRARECSFPTGRAICITALKTGTWYIE